MASKSSEYYRTRASGERASAEDATKQNVAVIHAAHHAGTPVVVRCSTADAVHAALSLGPVACALVADQSLLALDLAEMTYG